jgi:hypothetical protein
MKRIAAAVLLMAGSLAYAGDETISVPDQPKWKEECGSCHLAYPPQFLTAENWTKLMGNLNRHFGDNAVLDPGVNQEILAFLKQHAGSGSRHSASTLRISDTSWFKRAHDELPANAWTHPAVRSAANCAACHVNAAKGDWSEHGVRMPAGLRMEDEDDED